MKVWYRMEYLEFRESSRPKVLCTATVQHFLRVQVEFGILPTDVCKLKLVRLDGDTTIFVFSLLFIQLI